MTSAALVLRKVCRAGGESCCVLSKLMRAHPPEGTPSWNDAEYAFSCINGDSVADGLPVHHLAQLSNPSCSELIW